jgi:hypothetical protein
MTSSLAQQQALNALLSATTSTPSMASDWCRVWLGVSSDQLKAQLATLWQKKAALQRQWLERITRQPMDAAFEFLAGAAFAFYVAEKDVNPKVRTYVDAFYYIATCASVGYADIFAVTQTGRAVAALVMVVGPALTNHALERPAS